MKTTKKQHRRLPSPLTLAFYLLGVIVYCILNWTLLKAGENVRRESGSIEYVIVEGMLEDLEPVRIPAAESPSGKSLEPHESGRSSQALRSPIPQRDGQHAAAAGTAPVLEDWMLNTDSWMAPSMLAQIVDSCQSTNRLRSLR